MANLCIGRMRSNHELTWQVPAAVRRGAGLLGGSYLGRTLSRLDGKPFLNQMTSYYLAALGEASAERLGLPHRFTVAEGREGELRIPDDTDVVMLSVNTSAAPASYRLADRLRRDGLRVVLGGIHPTMLPDEAAAHADAVVQGEGEGVMDTLLRDLTSPHGLQPRYAGGRSGSLAGLPVPRWPRPGHPDACSWVVPVQTSRGCRNACSFCSTTRHQGPARRHRPVEEIVAEIRTLQETGVLTPDMGVFFTDNNIVSDSDHRRGVRDTTYARSLFRALEPLRIDWSGQGEIGVADDPELLDLLARAGCRTLLVGFESLSDANLRGVGKAGFRPEDYVRRIEALHARGIRLIGCFILGLDDDGPEVFDRTAAFVEAYIDTPQISLLTPFPGTAQHARLEREGRILHHDWSRYDITHVVYRPARMEPEELLAGYRRVQERIFRWPQLLRRAGRATLQPVRPGIRLARPHERFAGVMALNLVYRSLGHVDPDDPASATVGARPSQPPLAALLPLPA